MRTIDMIRDNSGIAARMLALTMSLHACKRGDDPAPAPPPVNEEELITTVELHFHSSGGTEHKHFSFTDLDGDGGNAPVIEADTLSADSTYSVMIELLDESVSPAEEITQEVQNEATAHQFFFQLSGANVVVSYADADGNGDPLGLATSWVVGAASTGAVVVTLRHEPDKSAPGVSGGDITNAGGETDIQISFPLVVE